MNRINIFDFDGTLSNDTWPKIWVWVKKFGYDGVERNDKLENAIARFRMDNSGSPLETFFGFFNSLLRDSGATLADEELMEGENYIRYHPGVEDFLKRTEAKNYIISGSIYDFLINLKIAKYFDCIYGTPASRNENGDIIGFGPLMTDDAKISAIKDILKKNLREDNDCSGVYYIGDGYSDADAMRYVHKHGGKAIFVYPNGGNDEFANEYNLKIYEQLKNIGVVDEGLTADFRSGSPLSLILDEGT